jgi:hypothetical protein
MGQVTYKASVLGVK